MVEYGTMKNKKKTDHKVVRFIDLFCGIGGFRIAIEQIAKEFDIRARSVFSCDIDEECRKAYAENFGENPAGDITTIKSEDIPDHDVLLAGFPCQPFSIIGHRRGFEDTRGTLFFDIARILQAKKPSTFVLENVKLLVGHNSGKTLRRIMSASQVVAYDNRF